MVNINQFQSSSTSSTATNSTFFENRLVSQSRAEKKRLKPLAEQSCEDGEVERKEGIAAADHKSRLPYQNANVNHPSNTGIERMHSYGQMQYQTMQNFYTNASPLHPVGIPVSQQHFEYEDK